MSTRNQRSRHFDAESGMNRVRAGKKKQRAPPPPETDSEPEYVVSDLESELEMPAKDLSVRKKKKAVAKKPARAAQHGVEGEEDSGSELAATKAQETSSSIAPHMQILLAATYHLGFASIVRPSISNFIPSCCNMFTMAFYMMELVSENTYLQEMCPSFYSAGFYCYVGYLYFYQILLAKDEVGRNQLTRDERRALRSLKAVAPPEGWPVPAPLIEFIRALGYYKSSNPVFSYVVPSLPDFSTVSRAPGGNANGYANYNASSGIQRVPPVTAYIEFLRLFGNRTSVYDVNQGWIPVGNATLAQNNQFMGMHNSTAANGLPFQALALSDGWNPPTEGEMRWGPIQAATKRQSIRRWSIPDLHNVHITGIENFLGLADGTNTAWINHLITMVNVMNRFFPGSTNLSAIPPVSHLGHMTQIYVDAATTRAGKDHKWFRGRNNWQYKFRAYDDTEQGRILARIGIACGVNTHYTANVLPIGTRNNGRQGPFFIDDTNNAQTERFERFMVEGETETETTARFNEQLSALYDATGGRKA